MRAVRVTYSGAYHHVMSRGVDDKNIFPNDELKQYFLEIAREKSMKLKIRIFAYCIMDNHYHLILQNSSGMLSRFMRQLNGQYGIHYRKKEGGTGYVFQGRYKSTLIQEYPYLTVSILYVLLNPVRAGLVENPHDYKWSSIDEYFKINKICVTDRYFVEDILESKETMKQLIEEWSDRKLPSKKTRYGKVIGNDTFEKSAIKRYDRRRIEGESLRMRKNDYNFISPERVIGSFERNKGIKMEGIKLNTLQGKKLRSELLLLLKDISGLTYKEIARYQIFKSMKYFSLGKVYQRSKGIKAI